MKTAAPPVRLRDFFSSGGTGLRRAQSSRVSPVIEPKARIEVPYRRHSLERVVYFRFTIRVRGITKQYTTATIALPTTNAK